MRRTSLLLVFAASGLACSGVQPAAPPVCVAAEQGPLPDPRCELDPRVADYKRDLVLTLWGYVGLRSTRLPIVVGLDARARIESVCLEEGASLDRKTRQEIERATRTLRAMRSGPACLAGTRLELAEDFADANARWRSRTPSIPRVEELCAMDQQRCVGWREPVCALFIDGRRATYPDACEACRAPGVRGYDAGPCVLGP